VLGTAATWVASTSSGLRAAGRGSEAQTPRLVGACERQARGFLVGGGRCAALPVVEAPAFPAVKEEARLVTTGPTSSWTQATGSGIAHCWRGKKRGADGVADRYLIENREAAVGVQMFHMRQRWGAAVWRAQTQVLLGRRLKYALPGWEEAESRRAADTATEASWRSHASGSGDGGGLGGDGAAGVLGTAATWVASTGSRAAAFKKLWFLVGPKGPHTCGIS
jgi:hypothetical protein